MQAAALYIPGWRGQPSMQAAALYIPGGGGDHRAWPPAPSRRPCGACRAAQPGGLIELKCGRSADAVQPKNKIAFGYSWSRGHVQWECHMEPPQMCNDTTARLALASAARTSRTSAPGCCAPSMQRAPRTPAPALPGRAGSARQGNGVGQPRRSTHRTTPSGADHHVHASGSGSPAAPAALGDPPPATPPPRQQLNTLQSWCGPCPWRA